MWVGLVAGQPLLAEHLNKLVSFSFRTMTPTSVKIRSREAGVYRSVTDEGYGVSPQVDVSIEVIRDRCGSQL